MIFPKNEAELAEYTKKGRNVFFFTADWCGDCKFIYPQMPEIEKEFEQFTFIQVDRDQFMELAIEWGILGIPSFVVMDFGKELGRFVDKNRKKKEEIVAFLNKIAE